MYKSRPIGGQQQQHPHHHRPTASPRVTPERFSTENGHHQNKNSKTTTKHSNCNSASSNCSSSCDPSTNKFGDSGLKILFCVHHWMGISYFGASVPSKPLSLPTQTCLIFWNAFCFAFSAYTFYLSTNAETEADSASFLGRKSLAPLVNYIRYASLLVYFCFSYLLNIYMGFVARPLLRLLRADILPLLPAEVEYQIGTGIALVQTIVIIVQTTIFQLLLYSHFRTILWDRWIENVLNLYSLSSAITAIAYANFSLAYIIRITGESGDISRYIELLMQLGPIVKRVTYLLGPAIFVVIFNATIADISALCLFVADYKSTYYISIIGFLDYSILMVALVLVSSFAYEQAKATNAVFNSQLYLQTCHAMESHPKCTSPNHEEAPENPVPATDMNLIASQLTILAQLENSLKMSPFGLFTLRRSYITTFFSFMLSYSVILIQTSESSVPGDILRDMVSGNGTSGDGR